jgi:hypothetical protein
MTVLYYINFVVYFRHDRRCGSEDRFAFILDHVAGLRGVVGVSPGPLYLRGKNLHYSLSGRLGRPPSRSGCVGEDGDLVTVLEIRARFIGLQPKA